MGQRTAAVNAYIREAPAYARPILERIRDAFHAGCPEIEERLKWGMPSFLYQDKIVCGFAGFKAHCALWFWKGKAIVGKKPSEAMGHFGRIKSLADLPSATELKSYVQKAVETIEQGR